MDACNQASEFVTHVDGVSNVCLVTTSDVMYNVVPYVGAVTGTGEIKAQVTACGDLILLFAQGSRTFKVTITRCCVIPTNRHHTLDLVPFRRVGCQKAVHTMHNKVQLTLDSGDMIDVPISVVLNHMDCAKIRIFFSWQHHSSIRIVQT